MNNNILSRKKVLEKAYDDCMAELYRKSQPSADINEYIEKIKSGELPKDTRVYERHYISKEELEYIVDKYMKAYNIDTPWKDHCNVIRDYFTNGGLKDGYRKEYTDKHGNYHPGYRTAEKVPKLHDIILNVLNGDKEKTQKVYDAVMEDFEDCASFYMFDHEASSFKGGIYLGASPTTNKKDVEEYWAS